MAFGWLVGWESIRFSYKLFRLLIGIGSLVVHYGDGGGEEEESDEEKKEARGEMLSGMAVEERPWWRELASSRGGPQFTRGLGGP